jgi:hypothetical protein
LPLPPCNHPCPTASNSFSRTQWDIKSFSGGAQAPLSPAPLWERDGSEYRPPQLDKTEPPRSYTDTPMGSSARPQRRVLHSLPAARSIPFDAPSAPLMVPSDAQLFASPTASLNQHDVLELVATRQGPNSIHSDVSSDKQLHTKTKFSLFSYAKQPPVTTRKWIVNFKAEPYIIQAKSEGY